MQNQPSGVPDPAVTEEVIEGRPWYKVCCVSCIVFLIAALFLIFLLFRLAPGTEPRIIYKIPDGFPENFTLYRPEVIDEILYYPASDKARAFGVVTAPIRVFTKEDDLATKIQEGVAPFTEVDTVSIQWLNLNAKKEEVLRFYAGSMIQAGVADPQMRELRKNSILSEMVGATDELRIKVSVTDDPETDTVDIVTVLVEYPSPSK